MELLTERVEEDIQRRHEVLVNGKGSEEDDLAKLQTGRERFEVLLHRLDGNL